MKTLIVLVGCGGIGSALFQDLVRAKFIRDDNTKIVLVDGDRVELKNIGRQHFSLSQVGKYKAEALAETASKVLNLKNIFFSNIYIYKSHDVKNIVNTFCSEDPFKEISIILVGCLDNHVARTVLESYVKEDNKKIYYIDCSNGKKEGEVVSVWKQHITIHGGFRSEYDPSVLTDKTDAKIEMENNVTNCSNEIDAGDEQTIIANRKAAIIALELISTFYDPHKVPLIGICYFKESVIKRVS